MCDNCKYFVYNLRWYIYYTVHTCEIVSFCFCKAVSFCIIYKFNYSSVSNKMFCSPHGCLFDNKYNQLKAMTVIYCYDFFFIKLKYF